MTITRGKFITVEGTEGAGKSTALQYIQEHLQKANVDITVTREPGGTALAEEIRDFLLHPKSSELITAEAELLLMFASRAQHIVQCIEPALLAGRWVVSDRYVDATYAYQGGGRGIDFSQIKMLDKMVVDELYPDLTFLFDLPAELGSQRTKMRGLEKDRIEQEKIDFFERVRNAYLERAKEDPKRIKIIDATQSVAAVKMEVCGLLDELLERK